MQLTLNKVAFDCRLLRRDYVCNLRLSVTICQFFRLRCMLNDSLLKLVPCDKTDELSAEISELHRILALFILAHKLEQPALHEVESHRLQIIPHSDRLAFTCQTPP